MISDDGIMGFCQAQPRRYHRNFNEGALKQSNFIKPKKVYLKDDLRKPALEIGMQIANKQLTARLRQGK